MLLSQKACLGKSSTTESSVGGISPALTDSPWDATHLCSGLGSAALQQASEMLVSLHHAALPLLLSTTPSSSTSPILSCLFHPAFAFGDSIGCCGVVGLQNPVKMGQASATAQEGSVGNHFLRWGWLEGESKAPP